MAKFKKGDRVRFIVEDSFGDMDYPKGSEAVVQSHNDRVVTLNDSSLVYADKLELITDNQPITPKVGEKYRVVKELLGYDTKTPLLGNQYEVGSSYTIKVDEDNDFTLNESCQTVTKDCLTTEYLELVEEEQHTGAAVAVTQTNVNDVMNQAIRAGDMASKPLYVTGMDIGKIEHGSIIHMPTLKKTKQTTMQKLTSALKRVLSAKSRLYTRQE